MRGGVSDPRSPGPQEGRGTSHPRRRPGNPPMSIPNVKGAAGGTFPGQNSKILLGPGSPVSIPQGCAPTVLILPIHRVDETATRAALVERTIKRWHYFYMKGTICHFDLTACRKHAHVLQANRHGPHFPPTAGRLLSPRRPPNASHRRPPALPPPTAATGTFENQVLTGSSWGTTCRSAVRSGGSGGGATVLGLIV